MVTDVFLQMLLTEVERVLNSRALTANSDDPSDFELLTKVRRPNQWIRMLYEGIL